MSQQDQQDMLLFILPVQVLTSANLIVIHGHAADRIAFNSRILFRDDLTTQCAHVCIVVCSCDATCTAAVGQRCCTDNVVYLNVILQRACSDTMPLTPHPPYTMLWYYETSSHPASAMITSCDSLLLLVLFLPRLLLQLLLLLLLLLHWPFSQ